MLAYCTRAGIRVQREHPNLSLASQWTGVFVTSTSRLALIVDHCWIHGQKIAVPGLTVANDFCKMLSLVLAVSRTAQSIRDAVNQEIEKASTKLL
jgi:hypothetical protein